MVRVQPQREAPQEGDQQGAAGCAVPAVEGAPQDEGQDGDRGQADQQGPEREDAAQDRTDAVVRGGHAEEGEHDGGEHQGGQVRDGLEEGVEGLQHAAAAVVPGGDDARRVADALEVALGPAGALGEVAAGERQALLGDPGLGDVRDAVAAEDHVQAQLVVLQQRALLPRPAFRLGDAVERGQAGELAVAAEADGAGAGAQQLHPRVGDGELHVLHADQQPGDGVAGPAAAGHGGALLDVPHPDADLYAADLGVAEGGGAADAGEGARVELAVGVDDAHHDAVAGRARDVGEVEIQLVVGRVEGRALALAGVGAAAPYEVDVAVLGGELLDDGAGGVVAVVVDDPYVRSREVRAEPGDGGADDGLLVPARHEEVPVEGGGVTVLGGGPAQVGVARARPVQEEAQQQEEGEAEQQGVGGHGVSGVRPRRRAGRWPARPRWSRSRRTRGGRRSR